MENWKVLEKGGLSGVGVGGTIGALPQAPAGNIVPCTLSPLRGDGSIVTEGKG